MIRVKLTSILVNNQNKARSFYTEKLGFQIKHDLPCGDVAWLTLVAPEDPGGVELLLEPIATPDAATFQQALYKAETPLTQLYTADIQREFEALKSRSVAFKGEPQAMGPTLFVDFDDTCGNFIRLLQG